MNKFKKIIKSFFGKSKLIDELYSSNDYLTAYSMHTDIRVENDPKAAIGGMWEEIGSLQNQFLISKGLKPEHKMLDIGCGTLRGGQHAIRFLNSGNYFGIDISSKAIAFGKDLVVQQGLSEKKPHLIINQNKDLKFKEFSGEKFDFILAQSVFTHLKPEHITECFENIGHVMNKESIFYFTYAKGEEYHQTTTKDFKYPFSFFESLANKYAYKILDVSEDYAHPRGQSMVELRKL